MMSLVTIKPNRLKTMVDLGGVSKVKVIGKGAIFEVLVNSKFGTFYLATYRGNIRQFKAMGTVFHYLRFEMGITGFEVDAVDYSMPYLEKDAHS